MSGDIDRHMGHIHLGDMIGMACADLEYLNRIVRGSSDDKSDFNRF